MFCPNCGTQNEEGASPCKKCGFKLSGVSAPKFKGTMMLSSDQSVQQLVEEHRRKLGERALGGSDAPPIVPEPDLTNSKPGLNTVRGGLQPARPALPRPRPGGTVLGVAPQIGGYTPATPAVAAAAAMPPARDESVAVPSSEERAQEPNGERPFVETSPAPLPEETTAPRNQEPLVAEASDTPASALRRSSGGAGPTLESAAPPRLPDATADPSSAAGLPTQDAVARPAESLAIPATPVAPAESSPAQRRTEQRAQARVRPLEVFLILITFGLYGLVLLIRQRRQQPGTPSRDIEH